MKKYIFSNNILESFKFLGGSKFLIILILKILNSVLLISTISLVIPVTSILFNPDQLYDNLLEYNISFINNISLKTFLISLSTLILLFGFIRFLIGILIVKAYNKYLVDLRFSWLLYHADYFNNQKFNSLKNVGTQVSNWYNDTYNASIFVSILLTLVENISFIIFFIISIYISSIKFGILFTLFIILSSLYFVFKNEKNLSKGSSNKILYQQEVMGILNHFILYIRDIKLYSLIDYAKNIIKFSTNKLSDLLYNNANKANLPKVYIEVIFIFIVAIFAFLVSFSIVKVDNINKPLLFFYIIVFYRSIGYLSQLASSFTKLKNDEKAFLNVKERIQKFSLNKSKTKSVKIESLKEILLKNLSFKYDKGDYIFQDVNLSIPLKKYYLFFSKSGSGKSTFLDILSTFLEPTKGTIQIVNYKNEIVKNNFYLYSYVFQNVGLFGFSIKDCICGKLKYNKRLFDKVIKICRINDYLNNNDDFDIDNLSGGQRMRIALARALYHNRPILILDESLSNVEYILEKKIIRSIINEFKSITIFHVAHLRKKNQFADKILTIKNKKIHISNNR